MNVLKSIEPLHTGIEENIVTCYLKNAPAYNIKNF